jgi:hypothetical protein
MTRDDARLARALVLIGACSRLDPQRSSPADDIAVLHLGGRALIDVFHPCAASVFGRSSEIARRMITSVSMLSPYSDFASSFILCLSRYSSLGAPAP